MKYCEFPVSQHGAHNISYTVTSRLCGPLLTATLGITQVLWFYVNVRQPWVRKQVEHAEKD